MLKGLTSDDACSRSGIWNGDGVQQRLAGQGRGEDLQTAGASAWGRCPGDSAKALQKFMSFWKHDPWMLVGSRVANAMFT